MPNPSETLYAVHLVNPARRAEHVDLTWNAIVAHNADLHAADPASGPSVYLRGDTLVRVARDEARVKLEPYTKTALLEELSRSTAVMKLDRTGTLTEVPAPDYLAAMLLSRTPDQLPAALRINRVVDVPVFGADGSLITAPGYHAGARTFLKPGVSVQAPGWDGTEHDELVREHDVTTAREVLLEHLLADFPFADDASLAHAVAMLLEPFVRELIGDEPTPLYLVHAHEPGVGKSLLVRTVLGVGCGSIATETIARDEEEMRKQLTATLMEGRPVLFYDNVASPPGLSSPALAAALTSERWSGRILGHSRMADVPVRNVWVATANNLNASAEVARRIVPIFLEPQGGYNPRERTDWTHPLPEWATTHRADLVNAALVLVLDWLTARDPMSGDAMRVGTASFLASYRSWSQVLGGILQHAGIPGFLGNLERVHDEVSTEQQERGNFLADLYELCAEPLTAADWVDKLEARAAVGQRITTPYDLRRGSDHTHSLATWFRGNRGALIEGYRVLRITGRHTSWQVEKITTDERSTT